MSLAGSVNQYGGVDKEDSGYESLTLALDGTKIGKKAKASNVNETYQVDAGVATT